MLSISCYTISSYNCCMIYSTKFIAKLSDLLFRTVMQPKVGYISLDILTDTLEGIWFIHLSQSAINFILKNCFVQISYVLF